MDKLERIKTEYMLHEVIDMPKSLDEARSFIDVYIDDMNDTEVGIRKSIRNNFIDEQVARIKNMFCSAFGYMEEDTEWFSSDTGVLLRHRVLAERFGKMFSCISGELTEDNFENLCGLAQFIHKNYMANYQYLESIRDGIEFSTRGITYYGVFEDTQMEVEEFFGEEFYNITSKKNEKVKK